MTQPTTVPGQPAPVAPAPAAVPPAPAPAPVPPTPYTAPPPVLAPPHLPAAPTPGARPADPATGDDLPYYQEGVQWRLLPPEQQVAYWMHRSRKHEERVGAMRDYDELKGVKQQYDALLTQSQTEHERAVTEARRQGETTAMGRANVMLVEAYVRAAAAGRGVDEEAVNDFLETSNLAAYVNAATGQVDTAKVYRQVNRMSPIPAPAAAPTGVPVAPVVPGPPALPGWPPQQPQQQPQQQIPVAVPGQPAPPQWYGQPQQQQPVPAAPQWPGQPVPGAPVAPGQPAPAALPDFGQGVFNQAPPSGLDAGKAAARARYGDKTNSTS